MERVIAFFSTSYGVIAAIIAAVGVIWGGIKTAREIRKWAAEGLRRHRERQSVPERTLAMVQQIQEEQAAKEGAQREWTDNITRRLDKFEARFDKLDQAIRGVDSQVGTLQLEKMTWAYVHYGIEKHPIPLSTLTSLEVMYDQYVEKGTHNHIPQDFKEVIRQAPIKGTDEE